MKRYIIKRVASSIIAILGAATVVFFLIRISGDPVRLMLPMEATEEQVQALKVTLGYNDPLYIQYGRFIINLFKGDFGNSLHYGQPALQLIIERIPATLQLSILAMLLASVLGILAGIVCAVRRNGFFDMITSFFVLFGQSVPVFWLGILLILVFAVNFGILPTSGNYSIISYVLPAITLAAYPAATITRLMRSSLLDVMNEDYIRTAKAKGVAKWGVIFSHALKNAFIPVLTVIGLEFGIMLGGAVVTETIFAWPGVGRLMIQAVYNRDFPLVQACVLVISFIFVFVNLVVDLSYSLFDPRIKYN